MTSDESGGGRTVVVGMKLGSQSRELLTWTLLNVAKPGDRVIALHVLSKNEIVDEEGKSYLLSLVSAFDSILAAYEGFCNLKQVDLKLKICRGSSIRKTLVGETKYYDASQVILGTARNHHTTRSSVSVAKYCAKKLSGCSVLAVDGGKIVFSREASKTSNGYARARVNDDRQNHLLRAISRTFSNNLKVLHGNQPSKATKQPGSCNNLSLALIESPLKKNCSVCVPSSISPDISCAQTAEESSNEDYDEDKSKAIVPVQKLEASSGLITLLIRELPESKPGWPLLRRATLSNRQSSERLNISVVKWALQLPTRSCLPTAESKESDSSENDDQSCKLDGENGAIVLVNGETVSCSSSPKCLPKELEGLHEKYSAFCRLFEYRELVNAISNFIPENLIGKGGSSQVYRGCLPDGKELAVKILKPSEDVLKEFVSEIEIITALNHKNVISLFGFCFEDSNYILVYDLLSRGSLEENLHGNRKDPNAFGWSQRYKVAIGVAEALEYLHDTSGKPVIHRDVKSSNILLSDDFEPQLSDFGLAKWASTSSPHIICADVAGTFGYLAPEYFMYGKVNERIDVYAYGVVLLELLTGRKPVSNGQPKGKESLVMWAKPILEGGKLSQFLDPCLYSNYDHDQIEWMILAATLCIRRVPRTRPTMNIVVKLLKGDSKVISWARQQINSLEGTGMVDDKVSPRSNLQSHLHLAFYDVEEDSLSMSSMD